MREEVVDFQNRLQELSGDCTRFCFLTRAKEFQLESVHKLELLKDEALSLKKQMAAQKDEDSANAMLSFEQMTLALIDELKMWVALKDDDPNRAWDFLVEAQGAARTAMQAHQVAGHLEQYCNRLHLIERIIFPPQTYFSPGIVIQQSECSICGKEYGECDHLVGKAYMGEMCIKIIKECEIKEISVVFDPANKQARMINLTDEEVMRDYMTWRPASDSSAKEHGDL
jgi:hypothetical protein